MIVRWSLVAVLAMAVSLMGGSANAGPITSITISLPANPDAETTMVRVAVSDARGNFTGRTTAPAGEYTASTACVSSSPCVPMHLTSLTVDGRRVGISADGAYQFTIREGRRAVSISGSVAPSDPRRR